MHSWSTFGARTSHEQTRTHKTQHGLIRLTTAQIGESHHLPPYSIFVLGHGAYTQMSFCPGTPKLGVRKFPKLGLLQLWRLITLCVNLQLKWGLKQSCSLCWELSNNMWHATCKQINQGDSWLLVVGNQIGSLTLDSSFGHKLCSKYPNGSCELVLDI
jgi:hypothetical protein